MTIEMLSEPAGNLLIILQTVGALSPFIASYLFYRYMKALQHRKAKEYFEEVKASEYWPEISKRKFMREAEIYAYDLEGLAVPGEHYLHPCIRGLRERQMYKELPGLEKIRRRYCWSLRGSDVAWVLSFFAAFYFSAIILKCLGDATGLLLFALQISAMFIAPFGAMYVAAFIMRKDGARIVQEYYHHVKNSKYWQGIIRQDFMQKILLIDPELKLFGSPASTHSRRPSERHFLKPYCIELGEDNMYEEMPGLKKIYKKYNRAFSRTGWMVMGVGFASFIFSIGVLKKIEDAVGISLTVG